MKNHSQLYKWQTECLKKWEETGCRGIVDVVTGAGKTFLAITAMKKLLTSCPDLKIKIVVPAIALSNQWKEAICSHPDIPSESIGFYHGKTKSDPDTRIMIYVINSARNCIAKHILSDFRKNHAVFLIADECHHYASTENRKIFDFIPHMNSGDRYFSIGLSATPYPYENETLLFRGLGSVFYHYPVDRAALEGVVSRFYIANIDVPFSAEETENYQKISHSIGLAASRLIREYPHLKSLSPDHFLKEARHIASTSEDEDDNPANAYIRLLYARRDITTFASMRIPCVRILIDRLPEDLTILIFCERIAQTHSLYQILSEKYASQCCVYHSRLLPEARTRILSDFREKRIRILISCKCLDEGIDVPDASVGIVLSSTSANRQRLQRLGRILRRSSQKGIAALYYLHVGASVENSVYLTTKQKVSQAGKEEPFHQSFLKYLPLEKDFIHPSYEELTSEYIRTLIREKNPTDDIIHELRSCIQEGLLRPDWCTTPEYCLKNHNRVASRHRKNYWLCMEKINQFRTDKIL